MPGQMRSDIFSGDNLALQSAQRGYTLHEGPEKDPVDAVISDDGVQRWTDDQPSTKQLLDGFKLWISIGMKLNDHLTRAEEQLRKAAAKQEALQRNTPAWISYVANGIMPASGPLILNLGSPDLGHHWELEQWSVGGTEVNVAAAGTAGLYVTAVPTIAGLGLGNLNDNTNRTTGMPYSNFYGGEKVVIHAQEYLVVAIWGGTAGQTYCTTANVTDINDAAAQGNVVETI